MTSCLPLNGRSVLCVATMPSLMGKAVMANGQTQAPLNTAKIRDQPVVVRAAVENVTGRDYFTAADFGQLQLCSPRTFLVSTALRF